MDALEMVLLLDTYGGMLTERQRICFDMRYNQDFSLGEIAQELGISRQAVCDSLERTEALLRRMEKNIGSVTRERTVHRATQEILRAATQLAASPDAAVSTCARRILAAAHEIEE